MNFVAAGLVCTPGTKMMNGMQLFNSFDMPRKSNECSFFLLVSTGPLRTEAPLTFDRLTLGQKVKSNRKGAHRAKQKHQTIGEIKWNITTFKTFCKTAKEKFFVFSSSNCIVDRAGQPSQQWECETFAPNDWLSFCEIANSSSQPS